MGKSNLIKFILLQIWVILRMGVASISSVCLIWVMAKFCLLIGAPI